MRVRAKRLIACVLSLMMVLSMANGSLQLLGKTLFASAAGENLALGKTVYASGTEVNDGRWKPDKVVDGVVSKDSRWSSNTSDDAWITIDLGTPAEVGKVVLNWELKATRFKPGKRALYPHAGHRENAGRAGRPGLWLLAL